MELVEFFQNFFRHRKPIARVKSPCFNEITLHFFSSLEISLFIVHTYQLIRVSKIWLTILEAVKRLEGESFSNSIS